ncbi:MAG TPA: hypothetical protein VGE54_00515 [Brevundimonas sp.]
MSVMVSLMTAALLFQTAPDPQPFRLTDVTVTDLEGVSEVSDLRNLSYARVSIQAADGGVVVIYILNRDHEFENRRIWKGDICAFEGHTQAWRGDRSVFRQVAPAQDEIVRVAEFYECREGPDGRPPDPPMPAIFPPLQTTPPAQTTTVVIVGVGPSPGIESGIYHTATLILGQTDDGDIDPYYLTFFAETYPVPPLGSRCILHHFKSRVEIVGGLSTRPMDRGNYISDFECEPPPSDDEMMRMNMAQ